jgi:hypothetical protein
LRQNPQIPQLNYNQSNYYQAFILAGYPNEFNLCYLSIKPCAEGLGEALRPPMGVWGATSPNPGFSNERLLFAYSSFQLDEVQLRCVKPRQNKETKS